MIDCSVKPLLKKFKENIFTVNDLPMKGKRKPYDYSEKSGR